MHQNHKKTLLAQRLLPHSQICDSMDLGESPIICLFSMSAGGGDADGPGNHCSRESLRNSEHIRAASIFKKTVMKTK